MRRVVANQQSLGSLGLDSVASSGAPPPGYTSQRDTSSSVVVANDNEEEAILNNSPLPESLCKDAIHTLPSPYSIEDLRRVATNQPESVEFHEQNLNSRLSLHHSPQGCVHGYTHTHSQCTPLSPSFEAGSRSSLNVQRTTNMPFLRSSSYHPPQLRQQDDATPRAPNFYGHHRILSADSLLASNRRSLSSSRHPYRSSTEEQLPVQAGISRQRQKMTPPYTFSDDDDYNPPSPYDHHPPPGCADIRILTYHSADEDAYDYDYDYEEYRNEEDPSDRRSPLNHKRITTMLNSTATILSPSEEPSGFHTPALPPHGRPSLNETPDPTRRAATAITIGKNPNTKTVATKFNPTSPTTKPSAKDSSTPKPRPTQTQPTNYVHLSRKCNPSKLTTTSKSGRKTQPNQIPPRLSSSSSAITGIFTINPELHIPPSLLKAMEDPVFRFYSSSDAENTGEALKTRITGKREKSRRTNLRLEVENGGIDVDIRLVPSISSPGAACIGISKNRGHLYTFGDAPVQAHASVSTSTTTFSGVGSPPAEPFETRLQPSSLPRLSTTASSSRTILDPAQPYGSTRKVLKPVVQAQALSKKKRSPPTTIDLRIKQAHGISNMQDQDSVKINGPVPFPLIAHIHAPNPRPPFHLFASTIDILNKISTDPIIKHPSASKESQAPREKENQSRTSFSIPDSMATTSLNNEPISSPPRRRAGRSLSKSHPQRVSVSHGGTFADSSSLPTNVAASSQLNLVSSSSSPSPLHLYLPRTFRGPLTIHISSGNVGDHLRFSEGLEREVALIRESECGRGYFVGGLGLDDADRREERDGEEEEIRDGDSDAIFIHSDEKARSVNKDSTYRRHHPEHDCEMELGNPSETHAALRLADDDRASSVSLPSSLEEWYGDRIEILVGSGNVYLQFEDEDEDDDPFGVNRSSRKEIGFWKRLALLFS